MIVNSEVNKKAKYFCEGIIGNGNNDLVKLQINEFCKLDLTCYLAVWKHIPPGNILRKFLLDRVETIVTAQRESLMGTAILYIMSPVDLQLTLKPSLERLRLESPEVWLLIGNEYGLEAFT